MEPDCTSGFPRTLRGGSTCDADEANDADDAADDDDDADDADADHDSEENDTNDDAKNQVAGLVTTCIRFVVCGLWFRV